MKKYVVVLIGFFVFSVSTAQRVPADTIKSNDGDIIVQPIVMEP